MRDRLVELIQDSVNGCARHWAEVIADHLLENGVIVPNLSIDDYVYQYNDTLKEIFCYRIEEVIFYGKIFKHPFAYQAICDSNGIIIRFSESELGKTVFLTREEAEQALKGEQEK